MVEIAKRLKTQIPFKKSSLDTHLVLGYLRVNLSENHYPSKETTKQINTFMAHITAFNNGLHYRVVLGEGVGKNE